MRARQPGWGASERVDREPHAEATGWGTITTRDLRARVNRENRRGDRRGCSALTARKQGALAGCSPSRAAERMDARSLETGGGEGKGAEAPEYH